MAPAAQANLYAEPNDIVDWLGTEGVDLRLDDHNLATGQTITTTATAVLGATSVSIAALTWPLIKGTTLRFDGGGMAEVVEVVRSATANLGANSLAVVALSADVNAQAQSQDSGVNVALAQRLVKACEYGTDRVNRYCAGRYNTTDLVNTWAANDWATTLGANWLCRRLLRELPNTVKEATEEAMKELKMVLGGQMQIPGVGVRTAGWPFIDNQTLNIAYSTHKLRLEQTISDPTTMQFTPYIDYSDALGYDWGWW